MKMKMDKVKEILNRETKGLNMNIKTKNDLIFSYYDVEAMLRELEVKQNENTRYN